VLHLVCHSQVFEEVCCSVVRVHGLGLTLCVTVNSILKFIYTPCKCKCIKFIYIILHDPIKQCKCKNIYIYIILHASVKHV
jgi:hypothetical protein